MNSNNKVEALTPEEVFAKKDSSLLPEMIDAVNQLLIENASTTSNSMEITIKQKDIVNRCLSICEAKNKTMTGEIITAKKYLDFENVFIDKGWSVHYDKPGLDENYDSRFVFKAKVKRQRIPVSDN